ncbi:hypothetical protein MHU86_6005 [Fragilaria crotonensis]|nr:hypothetical protein MHU86_6005 [Fragilaria crotonensis]
MEPSAKKVTPYKGDFVKKAAELGITIQSYDDIMHSKSPSLFTFARVGDVPAGFEQINDDLFARKDNKFMVFNGAGWITGTEPSPSRRLQRFQETQNLSMNSRELLCLKLWIPRSTPPYTPSICPSLT